MKPGRKKFFLIPLILIISLAFIVAETKTQKSRTVDTTGGKLLEVDLKAGGNLHIFGWDRNHAKLITQPEEEKILFETTDEGIRIEDRFNQDTDFDNAMDYTLYIPSFYNIRIRLLGGNIEIVGIRGKISGKTTGGNLKFIRLSGTIQFKTLGGDILIADSQLEGHVDSLSGRVLLENVKGDVKATSLTGNVIYKNKNGGDEEKDNHIVIMKTLGGNIDIGDAPNGAKVSTVDGDIRIKSASLFVEASTTNGDILLENVNGEVNGVTVNGDQHINITGDGGIKHYHTRLTSSAGDINLTIPAQFSKNMELELIYPVNMMHKYKISTPFNWGGELIKSGKKGNMKEEKILRRYKTGRGFYKITITVNRGNISIREK